jgi:hypothetical protein
MNEETRRQALRNPASLPEVLPPGMIGGDMNQRGGRVDILETNSKVEEALEESFPASDPPAFTQAGVALGPPPLR